MHIIKTVRKYKFLYIILFPCLLYYIIFYYLPMIGIVISFKDYSPFMGIKGIFTSEWIGIENFKKFLTSFYFERVFFNNVILGGMIFIFCMSAQVLLAFLINEVSNRFIKKFVQTTTYLPFFLSSMIIASFIRSILDLNGPVNFMISFFGGEPQVLLTQANLFRWIMVAEELWRTTGLGSIIYLAAISSINLELYESAFMDGAGRLKQALHITLPGIMPVMVVMMILNIPTLVTANFEMIVLLYSPMIYETADVISTYVYRSGLIENSYSYASAVGLFTSVISLFLIIGSNFFAKKLGQEGMW